MKQESDRLAYTVLDTETPMKATMGPNKASPFCPDNYPVAIGAKTDADTEPVLYYKGDSAEAINERIAVDVSVPHLLVGHNLPFDVMHIRKRAAGFGENFDYWWDTQLAEYLLSGQTTTMSSLDELSSLYAGTPKNDEIKRDYFDKGLGADHVPKELLLPYLSEDVKNTEKIFKFQFKEASARGMLPLALSQMDALRATTEMTFNGLKLDVSKLQTIKALYEDDLKTLERDAEAFISSRGMGSIDLSSPQQLGRLLFGGEDTVTERVVVGKYKNGKDKFKTVKKKVKVHGLGLKAISVTPTGKPQVDEKVLRNLMNAAHSTTPLYGFLKTLLKHRELSKLVGTYINGLIENLHHDMMLHAQFNHAVTRTGRLSSSNPNLQNQADGLIKKCFVSRFAGGTLVEFDFKQLEIVALAILCQDPQLMSDIMGGRDIHSELYISMYGSPPTEAERKIFKRLSFSLIYGAGAKGIAENAGVELSVAKTFVDVFFRRYPYVGKYHDHMKEQVEKNRGATASATSAGYPIHTSTFVCPLTKRRYVFNTYDAPDWMKKKGIMTSFSPTEIKNYRVQGLATADIVPLFLGKLHRRFLRTPELQGKALLVNTVHDSGLIDCQDDLTTKRVIGILQEEANKLPQYIEDTFGFDISGLPLSIGIKKGANWGDMEDVT